MQHDFILLDRSGSMASQWAEALGSVNAYVKKLADDNVDTGVTLCTFDTPTGTIAFDVVRDRITPKTWREVSDKEIAPRGMTPLNDAIGRIVALANAGNYSKLALIVMTDGQENASKEFSHPAAKALIDGCKAKGWQVLFLGANFDNVAQATGYGIAHGMQVNSSTRNLGQSMGLMANKRSAYASGMTATMDWSEDEKDQAKASQPHDKGA